MSQKKSKAKPRTTYITMDMGKPVPATGVYINTKTGELMLLNNGVLQKPEKVMFGISYERSKGQKSLHKGNLTPEKVYIDPNRMLEFCDVIYAIDTSCRTINSETIAVTGIVGGRIMKRDLRDHITIRVRPLNCLEFRNPTGKSENLGWKIAIERIIRTPDFSNQQKVVCVVDSDLGNMERYNSGSMPIYDDFYLPQNFQLIYASSDSGKENIANQMLSLADKEANKILKLIEAGTGNDMIVPSKNNEPYSHFRLWTPSREKGQP